jgi:hypothetical protein
MWKLFIYIKTNKKYSHGWFRIKKSQSHPIFMKGDEKNLEKKEKLISLKKLGSLCKD